MNTENVKEGYSYVEGDVLPTFTNGAKDFHPKALCDLVVKCLRELPGDRPKCTEIWTEVKKQILAIDEATGVALKYSQPDPLVPEALYFRQDLKLEFTKRDGDP